MGRGGLRTRQVALRSRWGSSGCRAPWGFVGAFGVGLSLVVQPPIFAQACVLRSRWVHIRRACTAILSGRLCSGCCGTANGRFLRREASCGRGGVHPARLLRDLVRALVLGLLQDSQRPIFAQACVLRSRRAHPARAFCNLVGAFVVGLSLAVDRRALRLCAVQRSLRRRKSLCDPAMSAPQLVYA